MANILIKRATSMDEIEECLKIRRKVFIEGQNVPEAIEVDGLDGPDQASDNYLVSLDGVPVGTARVRYLQETGKTKAKIERVAVLPAYQGKGIGKQLMGHMLQEIEKNKKVIKIGLSAQSYIVPFYKNLGYSVCSGEYMEAGIPHMDMQKDLH